MERILLNATEKAVDYCARVTNMQERLLSFDDMYDGYKSTVRHNQLTLRLGVFTRH